MVTGKGVQVVIAVFACGMLIGCGGGGGAGEQVTVVPVKGTVYLDDQPHGPAAVTLTPVGSGEGEERPTVGGEVQADGSFTLTTYQTGDGAPAGQYTAALGGGQEAGSTDPAEMMAAMGGGEKTAPLTVTIPAEGSEGLDLHFKSTKPTGTSPDAPLGAPQP